MIFIKGDIRTNDQQQIEIAHLLRQGASMVRDLRDLKRLDARFAERLAQDYNEALAYVLDIEKELAELRALADDMRATDILNSGRNLA